mgnify:CR=1 FL=1|jgi:hypothetical protein
MLQKGEIIEAEIIDLNYTAQGVAICMVLFIFLL